jgi:hypothetical protein
MTHLVAVRSAGATEEMITAAIKAGGEFPTPQAGRRGRPRKYRTRAECDRAYYEWRKNHEKNHEENKDKTSQYEKTHEKIPPRGAEAAVSGGEVSCGRVISVVCSLNIRSADSHDVRGLS